VCALGAQALVRTRAEKRSCSALECGQEDALGGGGAAKKASKNAPAFPLRAGPVLLQCGVCCTHVRTV